MIKKIVQFVIVKIYSFSFAQMKKADKIPNMENSLKRIKELGINPNVVFDVGAYNGEFSLFCSNLWPGSKIYAFEALSSKLEILRQNLALRNIQLINAAVGDRDLESVDFFSDETASSILTSDQFKSTKEIVKTKMISLNSFCLEMDNPIPNLLKIDTQGFDYFVLKGADGILHDVEIVLIECNFIEIYEGTRLFHEIVEYLKIFNFVIFDITEVHRRQLDNALFQIDFLFVKENNPIRQDKRWGNNSN